MLRSKTRPPFVTLLVAVLALSLVDRCPAAATSVVFTHVPAVRQNADRTLVGRIQGLDPTAVKIALFIEVDGGWYPKPSAAKPLTAVANDGTWTATIASATNDARATQIAAFVVPKDFVPPSVDGNTWLPDSITQAALAATLTVRLDPSRHSFRWSGHDWWVRDSAGERQGPGDNLFSPSTENVSVDSDGLLHLRITRSGTSWTCAEVGLYQTLGYGRYTFRTVTACDTLDPNAVLGLFTWANGQADPNYREIDIEWARWGDPEDSTNAQFVVQPYSLEGHLRRITVPSTEGELTHGFLWRPTGVDFFADAAVVPAAWSYPVTETGDHNLPESRDETIHLNLWLCKASGPSDLQPVEVVLRSFTFQPLDSDADGMPDTWERAHGLVPADAADGPRDDDGDGAANTAEYLADTDPADPASGFRITAYELSGATHTITFTSRPERLYDIESTGDLNAGPWTTIDTALPGTGSPITRPLPSAPSGQRAFYRVRVHSVP